MTKGYTLNYFIRLFNSTTNGQLTTKGVYNVVSPKLGVISQRGYVLDQWLGNHTRAVFNGTGRFASFGSTPRARLLKALRVRKQTGKI